MAIIEKSDNYVYSSPDKEVLRDRLNHLLRILKVYINQDDSLKTFENLNVDVHALAELLVRVDKRRDYFLIFHDATNMNEIKEAALISYWMLKFKPFSDKSGKCREINELFAIFLVLSTIKQKKNIDGKQFEISENYINKLAYAFKYWDLSKEAIMLIAETISEW